MIKSVKRLGAAVLSAVMMLTAVATPLGDKLPVVSERVADVASAETYGDFQYSVLDDGMVEITKYIGSAEKVDIPEKIDGKSVTSIGDEAFYDCTSITSVIIPDGVVSMGVSAFGCCTNLESITLPDSVTNIFDWAFNRCSNLTSITIPDGVMRICDGVFNECSGLTKVVIPNSVTQIGVAAFQCCTSLTSISISNGVTSIGDGAFNRCTSLSSITIPNSVTSIGDQVFCECTSLKGITIPDGVTCINDNTFFNCSSLTEITLPDGITQIGDFAFYNCNSLSKVKLSNGLTSIGEWAFGYCEKLNNINLPNSITYVGGYAFNHTAIINEQTDDVKYIDKWLMNYSTDTYTSDEIIIYVKEGTKSIAASAFNFSGIDEVVIPESVEIINSFAFYNCFSLEKVIIPRNVTNIGENAFGYYNDGGNTKNSNFIIYCYSGTAGEKYAIDNDFYYELLDNHEHTFGKWKTAKAATYTTTGIKIRSCTKCGKTETATIAKLTLANVTGFKVKSLTSTNVTLQWNKNANASGYEIEQYKGGKWVNVAKITSNATTSYTVKELAAGTAGYQFRMRAVKDSVYSDYTSALSVNTNPYGVGGFKCSSKTSTSVTLKWNKGTTASGYQLQQYTDGKWVTIYTANKATVTSYTVKNLKAGTAGYRFRIRAYKTYGNTKQYGSWSGEVKVNTNPYGVGGFKCSSKTSTSVTLKWNKGTTASGYQLQQYKDGKWVTIYTANKATVTSYTVKNLKAGTAGYRFRIRAYKTYGNTKQYGSWSSEVKVNTNPYGVGGFKAKSTAKNSITLGWNKGTTASGYQLQQYNGGKWVTVYTGTKATSTSYTVKSLKANTSYKFRIRAYKTYGNTKQYGSWSKELTVKTKR